MNALLLLALLQVQSAGPLVGDTVWIDREIRAEAGSLLRPLPWDPGQEVTLLGPPQAVAQPGGWLLRYPVAFWRAGNQRLVVPGPLVIRPDGGTDTLPPRTVEVTIGTLLPAGRLDTLPPQPPASLLPAGEQTFQPIAILLLVAAGAMAPLHWWWRRRRKPAGPVGRASADRLPTPELLRTWAAAGEWRLAADGWIARLEAQAPEPADRALLAELRAARFETGDREALAALCRQAGER